MLGIILGQIAMVDNDFKVNLNLQSSGVRFGGFTTPTIQRQQQDEFFKYTSTSSSSGANYNRENFIKDTFAYADTKRPTLNRPERRVEDTQLYIVS